MDFLEWITAVDAELFRVTALDHYDMGEQEWHTWWKRGVEPRDAAHMAMKAEGWEE